MKTKQLIIKPKKRDLASKLVRVCFLYYIPCKLEKWKRCLVAVCDTKSLVLTMILELDLLFGGGPRGKIPYVFGSQNGKDTGIDWRPWTVHTASQKALHSASNAARFKSLRNQRSSDTRVRDKLDLSLPHARVGPPSPLRFFAGAN